MRCVILTTGGTGGHIFPALAVAEEIRTQFPKCRIIFVGSEQGLEADMAMKANLEYVGLPVQGVIGRGFRAFGAAWCLLRSTIAARRLIRRFAPDVVVGFGGYAAFASVMAACWMGVPTAIHEQNSVPGVSNRILGRFVRTIFISLPDAFLSGEKGKAVQRFFPKEKTLLTGNPVRKVIIQMWKKQELADTTARPRHLLFMGGSQGAKAINDVVISLLPQLQASGMSVWHQTGVRDYDRVREAYAASGIEAKVEGFIGDMAEAYVWADLVICRAGATSVAELAVAGLPSVLIPFPQATHNHQLYNARLLADKGAALLVEQRELESTPLEFFSQITALLHDADALKRMAQAAHSMAMPEAAYTVVCELEKLVAPCAAATTPV